jgi:hypothetical protein
MSELSAVLERLRPMLLQKEPNQSSSPTLPGGYGESGGTMSTLRAAEKPTPKATESPPSPAKPKESRQVSLHSPQDKARLTVALGQVCELQKQYGKTAANLETLVNGFLWVLTDYGMAEILGAIAEYVKRHPDIPAPADIVNIIDPLKVAWKPDWAVYISLRKRIQRDGYYPYSYEREFLKRCDDYAIARAVADDATEDERTARQIAIGARTFVLEGPEK